MEIRGAGGHHRAVSRLLDVEVRHQFAGRGRDTRHASLKGEVVQAGKSPAVAIPVDSLKDREKPPTGRCGRDGVKQRRLRLVGPTGHRRVGKQLLEDGTRPVDPVVGGGEEGHAHPVGGVGP